MLMEHIMFCKWNTISGLFSSSNFSGTFKARVLHLERVYMRDWIGFQTTLLTRYVSLIPTKRDPLLFLCLLEKICLLNWYCFLIIHFFPFAGLRNFVMVLLVSKSIYGHSRHLDGGLQILKFL